MGTTQKLALWPDSWQNIFECLHAKGTKVESSGNFWAAIQQLERQFGYEQEKETEVKSETQTEDEAAI